MAKAILEFNLDDLDDSMHHMRVVKSLDMALVLWEFAYNTKKGIDYEVEFKEIKNPYDAVDRVFEKFWEIMNERNINLDSLIN